MPLLDTILNHGEVRHDTIDVTQMYYDTPDHDLQAQGVALYRRDGDGETGWGLEIPADDRRTELHWLGSETPLGDHQDTVVATEALRKMAIAAGTTVGENGFSYGLLYAREQQIARHCRQKAKDLR